MLRKNQTEKRNKNLLGNSRQDLAFILRDSATHGYKKTVERLLKGCVCFSGSGGERSVSALLPALLDSELALPSYKRPSSTYLIMWVEVSVRECR